MRQLENSMIAGSFNQVYGKSSNTPLVSKHGLPISSMSSANQDSVEWALKAKEHKTKYSSFTATGFRQGTLHDFTRNRDQTDSNLDLPPQVEIKGRRSTFHALQEWEGYVVDIIESEFVARLVDITAGKKYESEEATIPLKEVCERDASRMRIGSIFRWVIGYERSPEGTRKRVSQIVFRDLPKITKKDFSDGKAWAEEIVSAFST